MPSRKKSDVVRKAAISAAKGASWMSLLAATTLGLTDVEQVKARIVSERQIAADTAGWRLVVQAYSKTSLHGAVIPDAYARPRASAQRAITAEELHAGVDMRIVDLDATTALEDTVLIAWIEPGLPDLEYDGMRARPPKGAYYGSAQRELARGTEVVLRAQDVA